MSVNIRLPIINGKTEAEQLAQIKSYLYQFVPQLQWALGTVQQSNGSEAYASTSSNSATSSSIAFLPSTPTNSGTTTNFNELKSLIIKSAEIVEAFYDEITTLIDKNNRYVAQSAFGDFKEETNNVLYADGTGLTQQIKNMQQIFDKDGNIKAELLVNGHIFSGIIEYAKEGEAIIGIEIGQTTKTDGKESFNKFARFTADRLSFYDTNSIEVAYISDYMLNITNAWVKGNLKLGSGFEFDTSNGIALRPI